MCFKVSLFFCEFQKLITTNFLTNILMLFFQLATQGGRASRKLKDHMSSVWNWMDLTGIVFFWLPFILRFFHLTHSEDVARLFYIFDLFFWYMRILNIFTVSKRLGPVVTIILNMVRVQLNEKRV